MAGLDGVENKIHPGDPGCHRGPVPPAAGRGTSWSHRLPSLDQALDYLDKDRAFLTKGGVFDSMLDARHRTEDDGSHVSAWTTHPVEYDMYYSL